ncbi:DUF3830 family protein [Streptomyces sp. NPDC052016]|uniref:DUF3830 family protein n=1 Tax=Streptomyces sp. NPDC052016 TaxID=3365680 RepID=UPI0037D4E404
MADRCIDVSSVHNDIYVLLPPFTEQEPSLENATVTPIPGDFCCSSSPEPSRAR